MKVNVISETKQEFNGEVYYLCGYYFQKNGKRLHREVWKHHNGDIPKGYHVHHKDSNRANNNIENLELKSGKQHMEMHANEEKRIVHAKSHIKVIQNMAKEWHSSKEGYKWHSKHAKASWKKREEQTYKCSYCDKEFKSLAIIKTGNTFCSNNCKSAYRRAMGYDLVDRKCAYCGKIFKINKYAKAACCSRECSTKKRWGR